MAVILNEKKNLLTFELPAIKNQRIAVGFSIEPFQFKVYNLLHHYPKDTNHKHFPMHL